MTRRPFDDDDRLAVNTIRALAIDMVERANSGHPGLPMGAAPMAYVLWQRHLRFDPGAPKWPDRDRFVLSAGHGSALLYALLHLYGFPLSMDELKSFRQWGSLTPGHPEACLTPGVEATTGPLGQGSAIAVGMAIAERMLAARFEGKAGGAGVGLVDHRSFALVSDGDLMEGISSEAASLAGHLGLGRLVYLYDANEVSLDGPTSMAFTEDVAARYRAYGWQVLEVAEGDHDLEAIDGAIEEALAEAGRPSLIIVRTTIGFGAPSKAGSSAAHGAPLGPAEAAAAKRSYGIDPERSFFVPDAAAKRFAEGRERAARAHGAWSARRQEVEAKRPELVSSFDDALALRLPADFDAELPAFEPGSSVPTRAASGKALNALAARVPFLVGGDADLASSTKTTIEGEASIDEDLGARNIHFGVREHAMGAIANGLAYHGGFLPFTATFLAFSDYMRAPIRLAALDGLRVVHVFTHDSLGVGEDGPTHQPIEHTSAMRLIPGLTLFRPGDANEAAAAWRYALADAEGPVTLVLSRQGLPVLAESAERAREGVRRGGYVLAELGGSPAKLALIGTGSELSLALEAGRRLAGEGIACRVVSMPGRELFMRQDAAYRESVLPSALGARVVVEAGVTLGWEALAGAQGRIVGIDRFGASAPGALVLEKLGINVEAVVRAARESLALGDQASD